MPSKKSKNNDFKKYLNFIIPVVIVILLIVLFFSYQSSNSYSTTNGKEGKGKQSSSLFAKCGDGKCSLTEDSDDCCLDCGCPAGFSCDGSVCKKLSECGNGVKEEGETSDNCCLDAGCLTGEICEENVCVELKPEISATFDQSYQTSFSATLLRGRGDNLGTITLENTGNDDAKNTKIIISSLNNYFSDKTINAGLVSKSGQTNEEVSLSFSDSILDITSEQKIPLSVKIEYYNSANKKYESSESFDLEVLGRNYFSWSYPEMVSSWVTPSQPTIREFASKSTGGLATYSSSTKQLMAARWLFENMRAYGVKYTTDAHVSGDYVQFPIETLKNKGGDCEDNAILFASLLEAVGIESFVVLVPGHAYAGYVNKEGEKVFVETTSSQFNYFSDDGSEKEIIYPSNQWSNYPQVILPETTELNMPAITKQITKSCGVSFTLSQGWISKAEVQFSNSGNAPGAGCAAMTTYSGSSKIGEDLTCWSVNPGETIQKDYIVDISLGDVFDGSCSVY